MYLSRWGVGERKHWLSAASFGVSGFKQRRRVLLCVVRLHHAFTGAFHQARAVCQSGCTHEFVGLMQLWSAERDWGLCFDRVTAIDVIWWQLLGWAEFVVVQGAHAQNSPAQLTVLRYFDCTHCVSAPVHSYFLFTLTYRCISTS